MCNSALLTFQWEPLAVFIRCFWYSLIFLNKAKITLFIISLMEPEDAQIQGWKYNVGLTTEKVNKDTPHKPTQKIVFMFKMNAPQCCY